jgi:iron complex transport system substrate-binding protein
MNNPSYSRILSLSPSATETIFALELDHCLVGVTDSCDYPAKVKEKPNVLCWFEPDLEKLITLKPDIVVGLENAHLYLKPILTQKGIEVLLLHPATVDEALSDIKLLGDKLGASAQAKAILETLNSRLAKLDFHVKTIVPEDRPTVCRVLEATNDQLILAGPLSFQFDVILRAGGLPVTGHLTEAYPKVSFYEFKQLDPDIIFFCGYDRNFIPSLMENTKWQSLKAVQAHRLYQFDCGLTCRTGPRIIDMSELLFRTLYTHT